jgi:hypothetical protein
MLKSLKNLKNETVLLHPLVGNDFKITSKKGRVDYFKMFGDLVIIKPKESMRKLKPHSNIVHDRLKKNFDNKNSNILYGITNMYRYRYLRDPQTKQNMQEALAQRLSYNYPSTKNSKILDFNLIFNRYLVVVHLMKLVMKDLVTNKYYLYDYESENTMYKFFLI